MSAKNGVSFIIFAMHRGDRERWRTQRRRAITDPAWWGSMTGLGALKTTGAETTLLKKLTGRGSTSARGLRALGDQARDAKNWQAASDAYREHLDAHPDDADIWVQSAHTLKEQGLLTEAEAVYRRAVAIAPGDADARLHLAHLLKKLDQPRQAAAMFREVFELAPTGEVISELQDLGYGSDIQTVVESRPVQIAKDGRYLEVKD